MRFLIIRKADEETEAGALPTPALFDAMMRYNGEMMDAGILVSGDGLRPSRDGARVSFRDGVPTVTDGPFTEAKELIAGFSIIDVPSKEDAIAWIRRWPVEDANGNARIEIRPLYEPGDFGEEFTAEWLAQEERLRARAGTPRG